MHPLKKEYEGSLCKVDTLSNDYLYSGQIGEIGEDDVTIVGSQDVLPIIHCNTTVKLDVFNQELGFQTLVGVVFLSTREMTRLINLQTLAEFQHRNFFRVRVEMDAKAYLTDGPLINSLSAPSFQIHVTDLSLGGFFMSTEQQLTSGQKLMIYLGVSPDSQFPYCCQVQREQTGEYGKNGYGCAFIDNPPQQMDVLSKYLFAKQREQIRIARERTGF